MTTKSTRRVLGHLLLLSLIRSHCLLTCLLRTARFAALIRSLARSLAHSGAHGKVIFAYEVNASISYSFSPLCISCISILRLSRYSILLSSNKSLWPVDPLLWLCFGLFFAALILIAALFAFSLAHTPSLFLSIRIHIFVFNHLFFFFF